MNQDPTVMNNNSFRTIGGATRRARKVAMTSLYQTLPLFAEHASSQKTTRQEPKEQTDFGQIIQASQNDCSLIEWLASQKELVSKQLAVHGALLFRGFTNSSEQDLGEIIRLLGTPLSYTYRSTPRTEVTSQIYTSTEYPASQSIPLHNENAYSLVWPKMLVFHCAQVATISGGNTPLAHSGKIYQAIDAEIRDKFESLGVTYVRNYGDHLDLNWQTVFQTQHKQQVEDFCQDANIECIWKPDGYLQTRQSCPAVQQHPLTQAKVWFNQAHLFHLSALPQELQLELQQQPDKLPRHAVYGDGSEIEPEVLQHIRDVYDNHLLEFQWQQGDTLLLDNLLVAHGRTPYQGERKVLVAMLDASSSEHISENKKCTEKAINRLQGVHCE